MDWYSCNKFLKKVNFETNQQTVKKPNRITQHATSSGNNLCTFNYLIPYLCLNLRHFQMKQIGYCSQTPEKLLTISISLQLMYKYHDFNLLACLEKIRLVFTSSMVNLLHLFEFLIHLTYTFQGCWQTRVRGHCDVICSQVFAQWYVVLLVLI